MITSYFKTAKRVITRNRVFSLINVGGLAASMSVGLLFITILGDILRYDQFHEKKDRIVRVVTELKDSNSGNVDLATSSIALADEIRNNVPEAEAVTTVGHGFGGDFSIDENVQSLKGFWAQPTLFEVLSFDFIRGNPGKALALPNTIVITESAAKKLFGDADPLGKTITKNNLDSNIDAAFVVTGVIKDVPKFSHIQFEALGSFATLDNKYPDMYDWSNIWGNYTYVVVDEKGNLDKLQSSLNAIASKRNALAEDKNLSINFALQPLTSIVFFGHSLDNQAGPTMPTRFLWLISSLSIIVLIVACFNYTNLSVARASSRMKEIGVRKVVGAKRIQLVFQFITESTVISLLALLLAFVAFTLIRSEFLLLTPTIGQLFELRLTPMHVVMFVIFATAVGVLSGILPGMFFSKVNAISIMRGMKGFRPGRANGRKVLIVVQYVFALVFITSTVILYKQYTDFVNFDLGFNTSNIVNIRLHDVNADIMEQELASMPEVKEISGSKMVTSIGDNRYAFVKGIDSNDSTRAWNNPIDDRYLGVFDFELIAGRNLNRLAPGAAEGEIVANKTLIEQLKIGDGDPQKAIGEIITVDHKPMTVVGVVADFHYSTLDRKIGPFFFRQLDKPGVLNIKIETTDPQATMAKIESIWKSLDNVHPMRAQFYDDQIESAYRQYSSIGKVVGFLAFLTVVICSLGLLGMVIFSAESRMKEMSVRRVMGAPTINVTYLLSRNFLLLLFIAAAIAIPVTWFFFTNVVLADVAYHSPISITELFAGAIAVAAIALGMVVSQGVRVSRKNPAEVLRSE